MKPSFSSSLPPAVATSIVFSRQNKARSLMNASNPTPGSGGTGATEVQAAGASADSSFPSVAALLSRSILDALQAQAKRFSDMQNAVARMRAMPSANIAMAKSAATERAAMLKKILDMLKQMMVGATPAQAKAMAAQLKGIAKELAAMGKLLSEGSGTATATSAPVAEDAGDGGAGDTAGADSTAPAQATAVGASAPASATPGGPGVAGMAVPAVSAPTASPVDMSHQADTGTGKDGASAAPGVAGATDVAVPAAQFHGAYQAVAAYAAEAMRNTQGAGSKGEEKAVDDALRSALQDALKALRSLIAMLKSKLGTSNKDVNEAENKMKELANSLAVADNQNESMSAAQQIAQDSGGLETNGTDFVNTAGGSGAEVTISDAGGQAGGGVDVSA